MLDIQKDDFLDKLEGIKDDLKNKNHPIKNFIEEFDTQFWNQYLIYMWKKDQLIDLLDKDFNIDELYDKVIGDIKDFLVQLKASLVEHFDLDTEDDEVKEDLVTTYLTSLVLRNNIYFIIYNIMAMKYEERLQRLHKIFKELENVRPSHFEANDIISMDPILRWSVLDNGSQLIKKLETINLEEVRSDNKHFSEDDYLTAQTMLKMLDHKSIQQPYCKTIQKLRAIQKIENPVRKLEKMFQIWWNICSKELYQFWKSDKYFKKKELYIDSSDLKSIMTYALVQTQWPKLLIDILIIENFTPKSLQFTNRAYYMTVLHSAFEFIEMIDQKSFTSSPKNIILSEYSLEKFMSQIEHSKSRIDLLAQKLNQLWDKNSSWENYQLTCSLFEEEKENWSMNISSHFNSDENTSVIKQESEDDAGIKFYKSGYTSSTHSYETPIFESLSRQSKV